MATNDKNKQEYLNRKLRIAFLGESSLMSQNKVSELCRKFFEYGIEYAKRNESV